MTGEKLARIRRCRICEFWRNAHADVWGWPHCVYAGGSLELNDAFMEGPVTNCPAGYWAGLAPVDLTLDALQNRMAGYDRARIEAKRIIYRILRAALRAGLALTTIRGWIVAAIQNKDYPLWLAVDMVKDMVASEGVPDAARVSLLKDGASAVLARPLTGGNDQAWRELRDSIEALTCSAAEAQNVATILGITEPAIHD